MLDIGGRIISLRKKHSLSQSDLAKKVDVSRTIIGNYERNENTPSVEILLKISKVFDVSLDYLTGKADVQMDKVTRERILEVSKFEQEDKEHIFSVIDAFIAKRKIQSIL